MSVLVKDMKMPDHCIDCQFMISLSRDGFDCILQSEEANSNFENWEQMKENCPLIEVKTPHGRLIDADELMNESRKDEACGHVDTKHIYNAPTVIEAETNDDELKPCPFCNGSATIFHSNLIPHEYEVRCISCGSRTMTYKSCGKQAAKLNAIQAWNRRVNDE